MSIALVRGIDGRIAPRLKAFLARSTAIGCVMLCGAAGAPSASAALYPSQPAVTPELLCVSASGLSCFDPGTMKVQWRALRGNYTYKPVITSSVVLVGSSTGLHVRHAADGSPHWNWNNGRETASPVISSGAVYAAGHDGRVAAMDLADGDPRWSRQMEGRVYTPAMLGGQVIAGHRAGTVEALSAVSGETLWRHALEHELVARPVAVEDRIVVTTFDGSVLSLSPSGEVLWQKRDPAPSFSPTVGDGLLVFGGMDGSLRARDPATGDLLWQAQLSGQLSIPARLRGDRIAITTPDGELAIIHADNGKVLARTSLPGAPFGSPVPLESGEWRVFFRDAGEISWLDAAME